MDSTIPNVIKHLAKKDIYDNHIKILMESIDRDGVKPEFEDIFTLGFSMGIAYSDSIVLDESECSDEEHSDFRERCFGRALNVIKSDDDTGSSHVH